MCGIYAAIEKDSFTTGNCDGKCATRKLFEGLKEIEYRGYDNWGITVRNPQTGLLVVEKRAGRMPLDTILPCSTIGIGHTRWATHGEATDENSHPHLDCSGKIAIVHNGQIENYRELLEEIPNHIRRSQTDTEVIAHLVEREIQLHPDMPLALALRRVHEQLEGENAVLATDGQSIAGIAYGNPLVVGKTETGYVASSGEGPLAQFTTLTHKLEPRQLVSFNSHAVVYGNNERAREIEPIPFKQNDQEKPEKRDKNEFDTDFEYEIVETPRVLERMLEETGEQRKIVAAMLNESPSPILLGCGSAKFAAEAVAKLMIKVAKKRVQVIPASEFLDYRDLMTQIDRIGAFSQSGTTIDLLDETRAAQKKGAKVAAFVNVRNSELDQEADVQMHLKSGEEKAVVASKSFSSMIAAGLLVAYEMAGNPEEGERILRENIKAIREVIHRRDEIKKIIDKLHNEGRLDEKMFAFGRGISGSIAKEAALKGSEAAEVSLQGFEGGEFKHGMMACVKEGTPMFAIIPNDELKKDMKNNIEQVKARKSFIIGIGPETSPLFDAHIFVPEAGASSVIANAVAVQLIGLYMAKARNKDCDKPEGLAKSVTTK